MAKVAHWRDAMYRKTIQGLHYRDSGPERRRLGRGSRGCAGRRWHDPIQTAIGMHEGWQEVDQDRLAWKAYEEELVRSAKRRKPCACPPPSRFMSGATLDGRAVCLQMPPLHLCTVAHELCCAAGESLIHVA